MNRITTPPKISVTTGALPASRKIYVKGKLHEHIRVPMREIDRHETAKEPPLRVYDPSGPYTDPAVAIAIDSGLAPLREPWIQARGDVEEYAGRGLRPEDNGFVGADKAVPAFPGKRAPLRAKNGGAVTQLAYARAGVVTPEMEFVAIRENMGRAEL